MSSTLFQSGQIQRYKMTLSKETVNKLADALTLEVIDYIAVSYTHLTLPTIYSV